MLPGALHENAFRQRDHQQMAPLTEAGQTLLVNVGVNRTTVRPLRARALRFAKQPDD